MDDIVNKTEPYICRCAECMKLGPLYASMNKYNSSLTPECSIINSDNEKKLLNKKNIINFAWVFIILLLLISSKFLK